MPRHFFWKARIADGEHLVDYQDVRVEMRGHREGEAHVHARGVSLDGGVQESLDFGEGDDGVELLLHLASGHAQDGAVEEDILPPGQLRVKSRPDLEQARNSTAQRDPSASGGRDAAENFQQSALSGPVSANDADDFSMLDLEAHVAERPQAFLPGGFSPQAFEPPDGSRHGMAQHLAKASGHRLRTTEQVLLPQPLYTDDRRRHFGFSDDVGKSPLDSLEEGHTGREEGERHGEGDREGTEIERLAQERGPKSFHEAGHRVEVQQPSPALGDQADRSRGAASRFQVRMSTRSGQYLAEGVFLQ